MTGKKSVEEMKGRKEANHLRNLLCLFPSKLNIFGGGKKKVGFTYNFNYFPRLNQLKFNGANVCRCSFSFIFVESSFVEARKPKRWCFKPLIPMNLNNIFSWKTPWRLFREWNKNIFLFCTEWGELRRNGNS